MKFISAVAALLGLMGAAAMAADWPQFRGPNHDGISTEQGLDLLGPTGPKSSGRMPMLASGFPPSSVAKNAAYCFVHARDEDEVALAMNAATGIELWATPIDTSIHDWQGGDGPRSTPTVDGDRVYIYGTNDKLCCMDAAEGKMIWSQ